MDVPNTTKYIAFDPSPGVAPLFVSGDLLCLSARASEKGDASASQPGGPIFYLNKGHNPHKSTILVLIGSGVLEFEK